MAYGSSSYLCPVDAIAFAYSCCGLLSAWPCLLLVLLQVVIFMAGLLHNAELAVGVMGIMFQVSALAYMSAMAYGSSVNTRVSNELGAGHAAAAKLAVNTAVALTAVVQTCWAVMCLLADKHVIGLLSSNTEVVQETVAALPILLPTFVSKWFTYSRLIWWPNLLMFLYKQACSCCMS